MVEIKPQTNIMWHLFVISVFSSFCCLSQGSRMSEKMLKMLGGNSADSFVSNEQENRLYGTDTEYGGSWTASDSYFGAKWAGIVTSSSGKNVSAWENPGNLFLSHDYGEIWNPVESVPNGGWECVATSGDSRYWYAGMYQGSVYSSSDYGVTWTNISRGGQLGLPVNALWSAIAVSDDGKNIVAATDGSYAYASWDYGENWDRCMLSEGDPHIHSTLKESFWSVSMSSSGQYVYLTTLSGDDPGAVYYSSDYGRIFDIGNFKSVPYWLPHQWTSVATTSNGNIVVATNYLIRGGIFMSNNSGYSYHRMENAPNVTFMSLVAISSTGQYMALVSWETRNATIFLSSDYGQSWNNSNAPLHNQYAAVSFSDSGDLLFTAAANAATYSYQGNCPPGSVHLGFNNSGYNHCGECPAGTYTEYFKATTCTKCPMNTYSTTTGNNGEDTCQSCIYPWNTLNTGDTKCPVFWINAQGAVLWIVLTTLLGILAIAFTLGNNNRLVALIIMFFPAIDAVTDLTYIIISKFYNLALFICCIVFFVHPTPMFLYKLFKYQAWPYSLRFIWWLGYSTTYEINLNSEHVDKGSGDHIPFPTINGKRFIFVISVENHHNLVVVIFELFTWIVAVFCQALTIVLLPSFLLLWLVIGIFLQMTKVIAMGTVWNTWFYVWTGYSNFWQDEEGTIDTEDLNYGLLSQFMLETVPHIILQATNNSLMGTWLTDPVAIFSFIMSIFMTVSTLYKYFYHAGIRADPKGMKDIPLDQSVRLKLCCANLEYQLLNAKLEPHSRNIVVPTAEQRHYQDQKYAMLTAAEEGNSAANSTRSGSRATNNVSDKSGNNRRIVSTDSARNGITAALVNPISSENERENDVLYAQTAVFIPPQHITKQPSAPQLLPPPPPEELLCALTNKVMRDPVICADGYTYDRAAIEQHFNSQRDLQRQLAGVSDDAEGTSQLSDAGLIVTSPLTKQKLETSVLIPNRSIQTMLAKYDSGRI